MDTVKVIEIRKTRKPGPLRAFADIEIEGIRLKDFRVFQTNGKPSIRNPFVSYRNNDGELTFRQIIDLPPMVQSEVNALILEAYFRRTKERPHGQSQ